MKSLTISIALGFALVLSAVRLAAAPDDDDRLMELHTADPEAFRERVEVRKAINFAHIDSELLDAAVFHETNRRRVAHKLAPLGFLPQLREAARIQ